MSGFKKEKKRTQRTSDGNMVGWMLNDQEHGLEQDFNDLSTPGTGIAIAQK
jgi:hypothetical protein